MSNNDTLMKHVIAAVVGGPQADGSPAMIDEDDSAARRQKAYDVIHRMIDESTAADLWARHSALRDAIVATAGRGGDDCQDRAMAILAGLLWEPTLRVAMWSVPEIRASLITAIVNRGTVSSAYQVEAMRAMAFLVDSAAGPAVWATKSLRTHIIRVARESTSLEYQEEALRALHNLANEASLKLEMYSCMSVRKVLVSLAEKGAAAADASQYGVRFLAVSALGNLANNDHNAESMWWDGPVRNALIFAVDSTGPFTRCSGEAVRGLMHFSRIDKLKLQVWSCLDIRSRLLMCAQRCREGEQYYAIEALAHLSHVVRIRQSMWSEHRREIRQIVLKSTDLSRDCWGIALELVVNLICLDGAAEEFFELGEVHEAAEAATKLTDPSWASTVEHGHRILKTLTFVSRCTEIHRTSHAHTHIHACTTHSPLACVA